MEEHIRKYKSYNNAKDVEEPLLKKEEKEQVLLVDNAYLRNQQTQNNNNLNYYNTSQNSQSIKSITSNKGFIFLSSLTMIVYIFIVYVLLTYN